MNIHHLKIQTVCLIILEKKQTNMSQPYFQAKKHQIRNMVTISEFYPFITNNELNLGW